MTINSVTLERSQVTVRQNLVVTFASLLAEMKTLLNMLYVLFKLVESIFGFSTWLTHRAAVISIKF